MRKYYIFSVKPNIYSSYKKKPDALFFLFLKLKNSQDFKNSIILYQQISNGFDLERLYNYFMNKFKVTKKKHYAFQNPKLLLELNYSCLILICEKQFPKLLQVFSYYSSYLFVCDFENGDYFWLNEILEKKIE